MIVRDFISDSLTSEPGPSYANSARIHQALNRRYPNPEVVTVKTPDDENSDTWIIQSNERAKEEFQLHTVVWTDEEEAADENVEGF